MSDPSFHAPPSRAATRLGAAGVIPFVAGSAAIWLFPLEHIERASFVLVAYGAVILSFMGAVHWGLIISPGASGGGKGGTRWLSLGVIPALLGWLALMIDPLPALLLLALAFAAVYTLDRFAIAAELAPLWYGRVRLRLTTAVILCLLLGVAGIHLRLT